VITGGCGQELARQSIRPTLGHLTFQAPSTERCEVNVRRTRSSQKRQTGGRWRLSQRIVPTIETGASSERRLPLTTPSRETGAGARSHSEGRHFLAGSRVAHFSRRRDSPCLGLVVAHSRLLAIAGEGDSLTTKVSEASRTSGRRGQYPPRIRVGRRSGQRRRETPCPLVAPCWRCVFRSRAVRSKSRSAYPARETLRNRERGYGKLGCIRVAEVGSYASWRRSAMSGG